MYSVFITWAPDNPELRSASEAVQSAFDVGKFAATAKKASDSTMADIAGADIVVYGVQKAGAADVPAELSEMVRAFKGITLAGRTAAFFSVGAEKGSARLRKALKDTEASLYDDEVLFPEQKPGKTPEIAEWVKKLCGYFQEARNGRR